MLFGDDQRGFTIIELMVTIVVFAVLMALAIPAFSDFVVRNRLKSYSNSLLHTFYLARTEAITRNQRVAVCKSSNKTSCTGNWDDGWIIFVDNNNNGAREGTETIIHAMDAFANNYTLTGNTNVATYVSYTSQGLTRLTSGALQAGTFTLCPPSPATAGEGRSIVISNTGRPRIAVINTCL
jgi:type IV fimbrial biogenesis protein FimT